jgi:hypothetical protein
MSSEIELLSQLKLQLVTFLDEMIESFPNEPDFVIFRIFINDRIPIVDIMEYITTKLCPLKDLVKSKDEDFFLNNNVLFERFENDNPGKVNHFKKLWLSECLNNDDKDTIWKWFTSFIFLGTKYLKIIGK